MVSHADNRAAYSDIGSVTVARVHNHIQYPLQMMLIYDKGCQSIDSNGIVSLALDTTADRSTAV